MVVQARRASSRLPDKIFLPLSGAPLLIRMIERISSSGTPKEIVVATTTGSEDDKVVELCKMYKINCFRGDASDLLDRHYKAALEYSPLAVVKIPSDCPLICPDVIDKVLEFYLENEKTYDFVSNLHPATYPDGNDVEIIQMNILKIAWQEAQLPFEREHTTPFVWERPERFRIGNIKWETGLDLSMSHRFTIDYREDYEFIKEIYNELYDERKIFKLYDIMNLLERKPELKKINKMYAGVNWYRNHLEQLKTVTKEQTKFIH